MTAEAKRRRPPAELRLNAWEYDRGNTRVSENPTTFSVIGLREFLPLGQRITRFAVDVERDGEWREWCSQEAVGCRRLVRGERCTTTRLRVRIVDAPVCPALSALELYIE